MLREALRYPIRGDRADERLLVGAILALAAGALARLGLFAIFAVVPAVLLAGYVLAVFRATAEADRSDITATERPAPGADAPPEFSDFRALAADGVRALAVAVAFLALPTAVLVVTFVGAQSGPATTHFGRTLSVFGAGTVALVLALAAAYLLPAALVAVARRGTVRAAFDRSQLGRTATDSDYFVGWVLALAAGGLAAATLGALAGFGRLGEVLALALAFYALVAVSSVLGRAAA
jgi:hypothetical protein